MGPPPFGSHLKGHEKETVAMFGGLCLGHGVDVVLVDTPR